MELRFKFDEAEGIPHIRCHGVHEVEVEEVLRRPGRTIDGRMGTRVALGQTRAGRYLKVVYSLDDDRKGAYVITAFDMQPKLIESYRRSMRRRQR